MTIRIRSGVTDGYPIRHGLHVYRLTEREEMLRLGAGATEKLWINGY